MLSRALFTLHAVCAVAVSFLFRTRRRSPLVACRLRAAAVDCRRVVLSVCASCVLSSSLVTVLSRAACRSSFLLASLRALFAVRLLLRVCVRL